MEPDSQKEESYVGNWKCGLCPVGKNPPWSEMYSLPFMEILKMKRRRG